MPSNPASALTERRLEALRACAINPQGLRPSAYPNVMPVLEALGLVARRKQALGRHAVYWFLTQAGRELLTEVGIDGPGEP
ncbi:hypothetical protein FV242_30550 [Methylobacterium sp. WL64]|nr:hypothetical protein FV242_30550 [Methylobacterium sp. WL64]